MKKFLRYISSLCNYKDKTSSHKICKYDYVYSTLINVNIKLNMMESQPRNVLRKTYIMSRFNGYGELVTSLININNSILATNGNDKRIANEYFILDEAKQVNLHTFFIDADGYFIDNLKGMSYVHTLIETIYTNLRNKDDENYYNFYKVRLTKVLKAVEDLLINL